MPNAIKFKPYYNNDQYTYSELPQFILNEKQFEKLSFSSKLLFFVMYNKDVNPYTKKTTSTNEELYFSMTCDEMMEAMNVSKNTVKAGKKELLEHNLIFEISSKGKKANLYRINKNIPLENKNAVYTNQAGESKFSFIKVPHFLLHSHFNLPWQSIFIYSLIRHQMNISLKNAENGDREFVDAQSKVYCNMSNTTLGNKLNLKSNTLKKYRNYLVDLNLIKEKSVRKNNNQSLINYYVYEPIALPIETKENVSKKHYRLIIPTAKYDNLKLFVKPAKTMNNGQQVNKLLETGQNLMSNRSEFNAHTGQNLRTNELSTSELYSNKQYKHMKHMEYQNTTNISDISNNNNLIHFNTVPKHKRTRKYPLALKAHIMKYSDQEVNSFCNVINKGKSNINKALGTSYTIEAVERDLINAVNDAAGFGKTNNKSQKQVERYLMGAVKNVFVQHHERINDTRIKEKNGTLDVNYNDRNQSIELTPAWLEKREEYNAKEERELSEEDIRLRDDFLNHLKERWG